MIPKKKLNEYCESRLLKFEIDENILIVNEKEYEIIDNEATIFDENFNVIPESKYSETGIVYEFCGRWYLQEFGESEAQMNELKYLGKTTFENKTETFLGVHTGNELLNAVGGVKNWIQKASFLGAKNLGIVERKNLSAILEFQTECNKAGIKPITGMTVPVKKGESTYEVKLYAKNFQGWQTLLKANNLLNVDEKEGVEEDFLNNNLENVFIVVDTKVSKFEDVPNFIEYYQLSTVKFTDVDTDIEYLKNLEKFLKSDIEPVILEDAFYLEQEYWEIRERLWAVAKSFDYKSKNQYFKSNLETFKELSEMFEQNTNGAKYLFSKGVKNANKIANECNFMYDTTSRHLPKYKMTKEESDKFGSNKELFMHLVKEGLQRKIKGDQKEYIERINKEVEILESGDVIDYFLLTRDISNYAKSNGVLLGLARGSAGGCLVSYLLDITEIDPLEYGLIFERFLNKGRMGEWAECEAYEIETPEGKITLNEKSLLKVMRNKKEINIFVESLQEGDEIINY
jgi:DNA polymerase-3 subunit alpha